MTKLPITHEDLDHPGDLPLPEDGDRCDKCNAVIPKFQSVTVEEKQRIRALPLFEQVSVIRAATGCSLRWGKIRGFHPNGPEPKYGTHGPPCPTCGAPLR